MDAFEGHMAGCCTAVKGARLLAGLGIREHLDTAAGPADFITDGDVSPDSLTDLLNRNAC